MLDRDLAELYGAEVKRLNESVKRNIERFPSDFMFQLTQNELMLHIENNDNKFLEYDEAIRQIVQALNNLIEHPPKTKAIGFQIECP